MMTTDPFEGLDHDLDGGSAGVTVAQRQKFPCGECGGTGRWSGGRNRHGSTDCFPCRGKGYFLTDARTRMKAREASRKRKADQKDAARDLNAGHGTVLADLIAMRDWNSFAASLVEQHERGKAWSEKQVAAAQRMTDKVEAHRKAREAAEAISVDLQPIRDMFERARSEGYTRPIYRAEGLVIKRAPDTGRNPGALYVTNTADEYGGKVLGVEFSPTRDGRREDYCETGTAQKALAEIAKDPKAAAIRFGRKTGKCACCGRGLTNAASVDLGIGPICAEKWGL